MPLHQLAVRPTDVSGARLRLALNAPAPPPLATYRLSDPARGTLLLGVLGASHVITVQYPNGAFSEEVSCTARAGNGLPDSAVAPGYRLHSHSARHDQATFCRLAATLRHRCSRERHWLGGAFPGDDAALTALAAEPDGRGWRWRSWHLYPDTAGGTVVYTSSRWRP